MEGHCIYAQGSQAVAINEQGRHRIPRYTPVGEGQATTGGPVLGRDSAASRPLYINTSTPHYNPRGR